jgi:CubicO group peptidase (beta-lactamase class C family)
LLRCNGREPKAGLGQGFFGEGALKKMYREANLSEGNPTTAEFVERLAKLPLVYHPGNTWDYSQSTDVLGRVIEVVTGKSLYQAVKEMLLDPQGMTDTSFYVNDAAKQPRIGGGMVSTAMDYARFLQMLSNRGTLDGKRYLGPKTIAYMRSDHMGDVVHRGPYDLLGPGVKFGLGFAVRTEAGVATIAGSVGDYSWGGAGGTAFWVDPKEKMFVVYMMQSPSKRQQYRILLRNMIYAALTE